MNKLLIKTLSADKTIMTVIIALSAAIALNIFLFMQAGSSREMTESLKPEISEMQKLADEALLIKNIVASKEKKIDTAKVSGIVPTLEKMLNELGMNAKDLKPLDKKKTNGFTEESAELEIESAGLNAIVNLLYRLENSPAPLKIISSSMKTTFEDPDKFTLKLRVSLLGKG